MISTGINELDAAIGGGLREKSNVLLIGPPGMEKFMIALRFSEKGVECEDGVVYITMDVAPSEIESQSQKVKGNGVVFIDCYSWALGSQQSARKDIMVPGPSALNDLSIGIAQAIQKSYRPDRKMRVVVHSLSTLLLYNNPEVVYRFTQITGARLKGSNATTLFILEEGMHDDKVVTTIKHLVDSVIEVKNDGGKVMVRAPMNGLVNWKEIKL